MKTRRIVQAAVIFFVFVSYPLMLRADSLPPGKAPAPLFDFPDGLSWLNTDKPLKIADFKGKFVLLDFWTYCCINCMHIIPDLKRLEAKYPDELVVIGVHSAKFLTEQGTDNIREAILRYDLKHPVVNDPKLVMWRAYDVQSWPTVVLIDPEGRILAQKSGEGVFDPINQAISKNLPRFDSLLNRTPVRFALEKDKTPETLLSFPGKILADKDGQRIFISDSGHNRIVVTDFDGRILETIGSGQEGQKDGAFGEAQFFHPQGMALSGDALYIADTENHLIRKADLGNRNVATVAGIGRQVYTRLPHGDARKAGLNSPWDLTITADILYVAMAGCHQIWAVDLKTNKIRLHAGSGLENITDGPLILSALAQPSGLTTDGQKLYFADSEGSAVRSADTGRLGLVSTVIGRGLFDFGDIDGDFEKARLQHPLGIVFVKGMLCVADTYNNKIKIIDPDKKTSRTYAGTGESAMEDGALLRASFNEPGGISYADEKIFVADTNNNLIRVIDMKSGNVTTLMVREAPRAQQETLNIDEFAGESIMIDRRQSPAIKNLHLDIKLPPNHKFLKEANSQIRFFKPDGKPIKFFDVKSLSESLPVDLHSPDDMLYAELLLYYCREGQEALCLVKDVLFEITLSPDEPASDLTINYEIPQAQTEGKK